jgi:hypothetical protein
MGKKKITHNKYVKVDEKNVIKKQLTINMSRWMKKKL